VDPSFFFFFVPLCGESLAERPVPRERQRQRERGRERVTIWVIYEDVLHKALTPTRYRIPESKASFFIQVLESDNKLHNI
jgi:hypothetical protein